jgi:hypothetical protein
MRYGDDMKAWANGDKYEPINFKGFSYKKLIEQLPHYASDAAANIFIKKLYRHGMKLKNREVFVGAHATPLFESAMPDSVQKAARRMYGQSVAEWYKANKTMKLKKVPLVKLITQVEHLFMGRPEAWMTLDSNPIENLELARANSLKEAGVASGALDMIDRGGKSRLQTLKILGDSFTRESIGRAMKHITVDMAEKLLASRAGVYYHDSGVLPSDFMALRDRVLYVQMFSKTYISLEELQYVYVNVSAQLEEFVLNHKKYIEMMYF